MKEKPQEDLLPITNAVSAKSTIGRGLWKLVVFLLITVFIVGRTWVRHKDSGSLVLASGHRGHRLTLQEREALFLLVTITFLFVSSLPFKRPLLGLFQTLKALWKHLEHTQLTLILQVAPKTYWMQRQSFTFYRTNLASPNLLTSPSTMQDQPCPGTQPSSSLILTHLLIQQPGLTLIFLL